jgi:hypothetical protein
VPSMIKFEDKFGNKLLRLMVRCSIVPPNLKAMESVTSVPLSKACCNALRNVPGPLSAFEVTTKVSANAQNGNNSKNKMVVFIIVSSKGNFELQYKPSFCVILQCAKT